MSVTNWGMLSKSQEDPETIEEAIARLITAHNADEESHLAVGQSLQSHKASDIIDHLALSIVEDKIGDGEISLQKLLSTNRFVISCFESIDGWDVSGTTLVEFGSMRLETGALTGNYNWTRDIPLSYSGLQWQKPFFWQTSLKIHADTDQLVYFGLGGLAPADLISFAGFKVIDGTLYAYTAALPVGGFEDQAVEITGIDITNFHVYRMIYDDEGGTIKFYVDGVLKTTLDSSLPDENDDPQAMYYIKTDADTKKYMTVQDLLISVPR